MASPTPQRSLLFTHQLRVIDTFWWPPPRVPCCLLAAMPTAPWKQSNKEITFELPLPTGYMSPTLNTTLGEY